MNLQKAYYKQKKGQAKYKNTAWTVGQNQEGQRDQSTAEAKMWQEQSNKKAFSKCGGGRETVQRSWRLTDG